jgi:hypothetical protein
LREPVITPGHAPAGETAGPVRHPLARRTEEPTAVVAAAMAPAVAGAETKDHTIAAGILLRLALKYLGTSSTQLNREATRLEPTRSGWREGEEPTLPAGGFATV